MKKMFIHRSLSLLIPALFFAQVSVKAQNEGLSLKSKDNLNKIELSLAEGGKLSYNVSRKDKTIILDSPLGLTFENNDFTSGLSVVKVSTVEEKREKYELKVANNKVADHVFKSKIDWFACRNCLDYTLMFHQSTRPHPGNRRIDEDG